MLRFPFNKRWPTSRERIDFLWELDNHCFWCGEITKNLHLSNGILPLDAATIDHLFPENDIRRKYYINKRIQSPVVLSCHQCNHDRNNEKLETFAEKRNIILNLDKAHY